MQLTETQITQANALIKKYKFCSLETQKRLQDAGFFEKAECNFAIRVLKSISMNQVELVFNETPDLLGIFNTFSMPQFHEVWEALPSMILIGSYENLKCVLENQVYYAEIGDGRVDAFNVDYQFENENITESTGLLWLKLKEQNLL